MDRRIYLASSWRNPAQPAAVTALRAAGHEVYDFRNPGTGGPPRTPGIKGFAWSDIDPEWEVWSSDAYVAALQHPIAERGFRNDFDAMHWANTCVLLLPCGRSAHLEAGWAIGRRYDTFIVHPDGEEPELMAKMATGIVPSVAALLDVLS